MVRKITPTAGGWGKRPGTLDHHRTFERSATRALASLPSNAPAWRDNATRIITGIHGATTEWPTVSLFVTLEGHRALEHFAVTVEPDPQAQPVILGVSFFATAPFAARISPTDNMLAEQRRRKTRG